jgi:hypothetical protein
VPKKPNNTIDPLLPTVHEPGTYAWAEEVVECINAAWRSRETGEQAFLAAVRAAVEHQVWEILSPPPPAEPYTNLANLIRRNAEAGQAENMQIVIKYSGLEEQAAHAARTSANEVSVPWNDEGVPAGDPELASAGSCWTSTLPPANPPRPSRRVRPAFPRACPWRMSWRPSSIPGAQPRPGLAPRRRSASAWRRPGPT